MKKWVLAGVGIALLIISAYTFLWNGFSNIDRIAVQAYDRNLDSYGEVKVITDDATIINFTKMLNRADLETNVHYEMDIREDYAITVYYEDGRTDSFMAWNHEGLNIFLVWPSESGVLRVTQKDHRTDFLNILND